MQHRNRSHLAEKFHLNFSSLSFVIHAIIFSILVPLWFTIICLVCYFFFLSELEFSVSSQVKGNSACDQNGTNTGINEIVTSANFDISSKSPTDKAYTSTNVY